MDMNVNLDISKYELIDSLYRNNSREELIQFILDLDLQFAECDFTEELINRLNDSLNKDREEEDKSFFLKMSENVADFVDAVLEARKKYTDSKPAMEQTLEEKSK